MKTEGAHIRRNLNGVGKRSKTARVEWDHVEDVDTLHAPKELETLDTSRLLLVRRERLGGLVVARPVELGCNRTVVLIGTALCGHREGARGGADDARPRGGGRCRADGLDGAKHGCRMYVCWTMDETDGEQQPASTSDNPGAVYRGNTSSKCSSLYFWNAKPSLSSVPCYYLYS